MAALPFECVRDFIESSDVTLSARVAPEAIHKAFVELLSKHDNTANVPIAESSSSSHPSCACGCTTYFVDETRADRICADCGRAQYGIVYSNCSPYEKKPITKSSHHHQSSHAPYPHSGTTTQDDEIRQEVEHWNETPAGPRLGTDELARAKKWANSVSHASVTVKAVSALLFHNVLESFDPKELERAMRQGQPMPTLGIKTLPTYACRRCGAVVDTPYAAKRHPCGWGISKRYARRR